MTELTHSADDHPCESEYAPGSAALRVYRIEQAAQELCRYGGAPIYDEFAEALEGLAQLNEDVANDMSIDCVIRKQAQKVVDVVQAIVAKAASE